MIAKTRWLSRRGWYDAARRRLAAGPQVRLRSALPGLLIACMTGWVVWEVVRPLDCGVASEPLAQVSRTYSLPANPSTAVPPASFQQRVLFKARNQAAANASVQATAQELLKNLQLRSITRQGPGWIAYIQVKGEGIKRAAAGEKVSEFTVVQVDSNMVHLKLATESVELGF